MAVNNLSFFENKSQFIFNEKQVRVEIINNEPWFVAKDVCEILDLDTSQTRRLDDDEKGLYNIQTLGGIQQMVVINESGLYSLILTSRKPEAKAFKKWITNEVLPSIRKTGVYVNPYLNMSPVQLLENALEEAKKNEALQILTERQQQQISVLKPKTEVYDQFITANSAVTIEEFAKMCKFSNKKGELIGRNNMFKLLRQMKILQANNNPYQDFMKYFTIKQKPIYKGASGFDNVIIPLVTPQGQAWLHKKVKEFLGK